MQDLILSVSEYKSPVDTYNKLLKENIHLRVVSKINITDTAFGFGPLMQDKIPAERSRKFSFAGNLDKSYNRSIIFILVPSA